MSEINLTLEPFEGQDTAPQAPVTVPEPEQPPAELSAEEQQMVDAFAQKIDLNNSNMVLQYGVGAQKKIADFSESALKHMQTKDLGEIGDMLAGVVSELRGFEEEEKSFLGFFKRSGNKLANLRIKYDKAENNINQVCKVLENHQIQLLKDITMLDKMYEANTTYFKELSMYILAGKQKLKQTEETELPALKAKAQASGLPEDAQAANDLAALCSRFDKKLHDLELTRMVSLQMAPQIRLIQGNDTLMSEKIQSTLVNTIPLWKSQMILAVGTENAAEATRAQQAVTDMTNDLLKKNAEKLKMATVETAKATERGIIDMETLRQTNASLISTLDEVVQIQAQGREKRREAEAELAKLEGELKDKLLTFAR